MGIRINASIQPDRPTDSVKSMCLPKVTLVQNNIARNVIASGCVVGLVVIVIKPFYYNYG